MGTPLWDYSNNLPLMQCSCTYDLCDSDITSLYLCLQGGYTTPVFWDRHLWDSSCMWLCKCTSCNNFCHVRIVPFSFCIYSSAEINIDFCYSNSGFPSDQIFEYSSYSRRQQNFHFWGMFSFSWTCCLQIQQLLTIQLLGIEHRTSGLSHRCYTTELWQPNNYRPSQSVA